MDFLTRRLGPLPRWGWAMLAVGGYVLYRRHQANVAASSSVPTAATSNVLQGGELSPEYSPDYGGQFSLSSDSLLPVSAIAQTSGTSSAANAPSNGLQGGTGLVTGTTSTGPGTKYPRALVA